MVYILASFLKTHLYGENGERTPVPLDNDNGILDCIKKYLPHRKKLVCVANDPHDYEDNDNKLKVVAQSFKMTGIAFERAVCLDGRSAAAAEEILRGASLIVLSGGKCLCQNEFFKSVGLERLLRGGDGVTIGISAGAMNLCKTVANFPEEETDLAEPRFFDGLGIFDGVVIPHFDGETQKYQLDFGGEWDAARDYILPMSQGREFIGLPNLSYIVIDGGGAHCFGKAYKIADGKVIALSEAWHG